jgi:hypothetical protein
MSTIDMSGVVLDLMTGAYTVTRTTPATTGSDGRAVSGTPSTLGISASVQPLNGRDLLRLPEGMRTMELLKVYSPTQLFVQGAAQDPDTIAVDGIDYQVETAEQWGDSGNYWKMLVRKVGREGP